jgi:hypothetical protein
MKLKYSPVLYNANSPACSGFQPDSNIVVMDDNVLNVDGNIYEFDPLDVAWPTINQDTEGVILEAHREGGVIHATVRRFYTSDWQSWYSEDYK